jgi:hypothetical protein
VLAFESLLMARVILLGVFVGSELYWAFVHCGYLESITVCKCWCLYKAMVV